MKLSSHKSEATIKEYATTCPENKRKEMFNSLTNAMNPSKKQKIKPSSAIGKGPTDEHLLNFNLPNFQLEELDQYDTIDDKVLMEIMEEHDKENTTTDTNTNNYDVQTANALISKPQVAPMSQINKQVINQQVPPQHPFHMPSMYFPNSNVTINYNFSK